MDAVKDLLKNDNPPIPLNADKLQFFQFNNSALFAKSQLLDSVLWDLGITASAYFSIILERQCHRHY